MVKTTGLRGRGTTQAILCPVALATAPQTLLKPSHHLESLLVSICSVPGHASPLSRKFPASRSETPPLHFYEALWLVWGASHSLQPQTPGNGLKTWLTPRQPAVLFLLLYPQTWSPKSDPLFHLRLNRICGHREGSHQHSNSEQVGQVGLGLLPRPTHPAPTLPVSSATQDSYFSHYSHGSVRR